MNYYVFRINYDDFHDVIRGEMLQGRLRQGWGPDGMDVNQTFESYCDAWRRVWNDNKTDDEYIKRKYDRISYMKEMKSGDIIVVPKVNLKDKSKWNSFTVLKVTGTYHFSPLKTDGQGKTDFGHIIDVENLFSCSYQLSGTDAPLKISAKFNSYRSPINRVAIKEVKDAIDELLDKYHKDVHFFDKGDASLTEALVYATKDDRETYLGAIVKTLNSWSANRLEKTVEELFEKNGYMRIGRNQWDGQGGDKDLVFRSFVNDSLMNKIFDFADDNILYPEIRIQVKKKSGTDNNDMEGINQLVNMMPKGDRHNCYNSYNIVNIVINTTDSFSDSAKQEARKHKIILINGKQFASLLVKYGIDVFNVY